MRQLKTLSGTAGSLERFDRADDLNALTQKTQQAQPTVTSLDLAWTMATNKSRSALKHPERLCTDIHANNLVGVLKVKGLVATASRFQRKTPSHSCSKGGVGIHCNTMGRY